ncbi:MAG TPA: response regulator [Cyclobacteriaceae bacterium]|nr:response regulator [Cyclobacteriaceae bacterium]
MLILIADDDNEDREIFREAIKEIDSSINCLELRNGKETLDFLTRELVVLPNYVFLDINMPILDGKSCLTKMKSNPALKSIPVIMYSTSFNPEEIQECYRMGAEKFITKPGSFIDLLASLQPVLKD